MSRSYSTITKPTDIYRIKRRIQNPARVGLVSAVTRTYTSKIQHLNISANHTNKQKKNNSSLQIQLNNLPITKKNQEFNFNQTQNTTT